MNQDLPDIDLYSTFGGVSDHKKNKKFLPKTSYPGGTSALRKFIGKELKYPKEALQKKVEGVVRIRVAIDYKGNVTDSTIVRSLGSGCDEEAQRIVSLMQWQVDRKLRKGKILFHRTLNIHFKLPKPKKKASKAVQTQVKYSITPAQPKPAEESKPKSNSGGYTYTIRY